MSVPGCCSTRPISCPTLHHGTAARPCDTTPLPLAVNINPNPDPMSLLGKDLALQLTGRLDLPACDDWLTQINQSVVNVDDSR